MGCARRMRSFRRYCARNASRALGLAPPVMIWRVTSSIASGCAASSDSVARYRSATHGPSYNSRAVSSSGSMSISWGSPPSSRRRCTLASNNSAYDVLPKNSSCAVRGTPKRNFAPRPQPRRAGSCAVRDQASAASNFTATAATRAASSAVSAKIDTASSDRHAGTTPRMLNTTERGLVADQIVEGGGHAAGARGIGAQRKAARARAPPPPPSPSSRPPLM